jgi:hypothetical protein
MGLGAGAGCGRRAASSPLGDHRDSRRSRAEHLILDEPVAANWTPAFAGVTPSSFRGGDTLQPSRAVIPPTFAAVTPPAFAGDTLRDSQALSCVAAGRSPSKEGCHPREGGGPESPPRKLIVQRLVEVSPVRIEPFDQLEFRPSLPFLQLLLPRDRFPDIAVVFVPDERLDAVFRGELQLRQLR